MISLLFVNATFIPYTRVAFSALCSCEPDRSAVQIFSGRYKLTFRVRLNIHTCVSFILFDFFSTFPAATYRKLTRDRPLNRKSLSHANKVAIQVRARKVLLFFLFFFFFQVFSRSPYVSAAFNGYTKSIVLLSSRAHAHNTYTPGGRVRGNLHIICIGVWATGRPC